MKKILLATFIACCSFQASAQCQLVNGQTPLGSSNFDSNTAYTVLIDTTNPNNIWHIGTPQKQFLNAAYSAVNALVTDTVNLPAPNDTSYATLIIPWEWAYTYVKFRHKYSIDSIHQQAYLECSYDKGSTWYLLDSDGNGLGGCEDAHYRDWQYCDLDTTGLDYNHPFSGTSNGWHQSGYLWEWFAVVRMNEADTVPPCVVPPDTLLVRFVFITDSVQSGHEGWMIDDLQVSMVQPGFGIDEVETMPIEIFPNPARNWITIRLPDAETAWWITNTFGQRVMSISNGLRYANLSELTPGFYVVEAQSPNGAVGRKAFVKQ